MAVIKGFSVFIIMAMCILFAEAGNGTKLSSFGEPALAATTASSGSVVWKTQKGYWYAYKNGQKLKGLQQADGKTYYFDSKGRQKTGWRNIGGKYCYFTVENGGEGCLVTRKRVNGIQIDKNGTARVTSGTKSKLSLLVRYQTLADSLVKPAMTQEKKLTRIFLYVRKSRYRATPDPGYSGRWDESLADSFMNRRCGDCLGKAAGFAYLANALGCKKVTLIRNGHAFVVFEKRIYDVSLANSKPGAGSLEYFQRKYTDKLVKWHAAQIRKKSPSRVI